MVLGMGARPRPRQGREETLTASVPAKKQTGSATGASRARSGATGRANKTFENWRIVTMCDGRYLKEFPQQ